MSYEQFREQCAAVCDEAKKEISPDYIIGEDVRDAGIACCENIAKRIRALSLPEVTQEPILFQYRTAPDWARPRQWSEWKDCTEAAYADYTKMPRLHNWIYETRILYDVPADAEALRKENEQLRAENKELMNKVEKVKAAARGRLKQEFLNGKYAGFQELTKAFSQSDRWRMAGNLSHGAVITSIEITSSLQLPTILSGGELTYAPVKYVFDLAALKGGAA